MNDLPPRRNIKLVIAYNGAAYHGWQRQADGIDTVQQRIEEAAADVLRQKVVVFGAGRRTRGSTRPGRWPTSTRRTSPCRFGACAAR